MNYFLSNMSVELTIRLTVIEAVVDSCRVLLVLRFELTLA